MARFEVSETRGRFPAPFLDINPQLSHFQLEPRNCRIPTWKEMWDVIWGKVNKGSLLDMVKENELSVGWFNSLNTPFVNLLT